MSMEIQAALDLADETDSFLQLTDVVYDKETEVGYDSLTELEKTIFCIDGLLREMENGGFAQFFRQEAGAYSDDTLDALERIKAKESAALLRKMLNYFSDGKAPTDEDDRLDALNQIEDEHADDISALDDRFYDAGENLVGLTLLYVQKNLKAAR